MSDTRPPVIDAEAVEVAANAPKPSAQSFLPAVQTAAADIAAPARKTRRWKLTIEYDGTDFAGWQRQDGGITTIQGSIEDAIEKYSGERVTVHVAGRTDAGVHALGQVAHIDLARPADEKTVRDAINFHLRPLPISIVSAESVSDDFHARFSATWRVYAYRILCDRRAAPAIGGGQVWHHSRDLDIDAMNKAVKHLTGTHDFSSFRAAECQAKSPVRTLARLEFVEDKTNPMLGRHLTMWAEARSFLHHQIRNFAGTLALVGEGKWHPDDVKAVLEACDRTKAGPMAPASGLHLVRVEYGPKEPFQQGLDSLI